MLAIELVAPFAILLPARFRQTRVIACGLMILLQVGISATGNYGFFNLLAIVLYLALLDDQTLRRGAIAQPVPVTPRPEPTIWRLTTSVAAVVIACLSLVAFVREIQTTAGTPTQIARAWPGRVLEWVSPFRSVNGYGLFRVMTTARPELVIEISENGRDFKEYEFRWKPGDPSRRPAFVEPHMPRLDWQMWFAALDPPGAQYWLESLARRMTDGEPSVIRLLGPSPVGVRPRVVRLASMTIDSPREPNGRRAAPGGHEHSGDTFQPKEWQFVSRSKWNPALACRRVAPRVSLPGRLGQRHFLQRACG
jgi:hypothetical protein